jgi:hypothetical protein
MFRIFTTSGDRAVSRASMRLTAGHRLTFSNTLPQARSISESSASVLQLIRRFFHSPTELTVATRLQNDPLVDGMAERVRAVIERQPGHRIDVVAQTLGLPPERLEHLMRKDDVIDAVFLIDVIAALVHEAGIDPKWLLTGHYDPAMHRKALLLGEDRSPSGARVMRNFVEGEYQRVRTAAMLVAGTDASRELDA